MSDSTASDAPDTVDSDAPLLPSNEFASACMQLPTPDSPESPPPDQQGQPVLPTHSYPSDEAMDVLDTHTHPLNIAHELADSPPTSIAPGSPPGNGAGFGGNTGADTGTNALGLSLMQSSPPPHSYRHSRAYRHFKNPPQPHMCIRTTTEAGEELFINVLSWTRIVIPQEPSDPIPLYGGMRVPPGSPRSPPIVFAVMANPEVLKDSGRHSKDPEERRAMVELMCDFVEAMNPGVKLVRNAVILKDRDISGELKDVWNAVQAQRDREREEQMLQQRQQQHCHNVTTQQMFPKTPENNRAAAAQQKAPGEKTSAGATTRAEASEQSAVTQSTALLEQNGQLPVEEPVANCVIPTQTPGSGGSEGYANGNVSHDPAAVGLNGNDNTSLNSQQNGLGMESNDQIDATAKQLNRNEAATTANATTQLANIICANNSHNSPTAHDNHAQNANQPAKDLTTTPSNTTTAITSPAPTTQPTSATATATVAPVATPVKKDKLGGFLPNGCIFPRFKNNKHKDKDKDKDKDKEKETKSKDKEKTLLNALKKSKEKKVTPLEQTEKTSPEADTKSQYEKNCINLESEVQKLDLNKIDAGANNDNMFIKLKVTATK